MRSCRPSSNDGEWQTHAVVAPHEVMDTYKARDLFHKMAEAAHLCGDPGIQYDTTINEWHTSATTDRIHASNPCSEYMFLNDTACNLASLNLMKFVGADGEFDVDDYRFAAKVTLTAQEILVDNASYPTPKIEENSHKFRPLGLGYANLGALLMSRGLAYDSDEGRNYAAALTAIMHGEAYKQSSIVARDHGGPFASYDENREPFLRVINKHRDAAYQIPADQAVPKDMIAAARSVYDEALELGEQYGYRNAQVTVLAPTGTIAFMMDCDTTGVEPDIALIKYKKLVGEGFLKIVNQTVPAALRKLGYGAEEVDEILAYLTDHETIEGAPHLKPQHLPVFDCAFKPANGERSIHYMGHVRMMGAIQPFISGAISKTVNMPEAATAEEIEKVYLEGWKLGLKAIAVYRDNSKRSQPLSTGKKKDGDAARHRGLDRRGREAAGAAGQGPGRGGTPPSTPAPGRALGGHPQVRHLGPRGLHHGRPLPGRPARRDLPQDGQGGLDRVGPDGQLRDDGRPWRSSTACRSRTSSTSSPTSGSSRAASPATRRSRSPSRSSTTSSVGSVRASCRPTTRRTSDSSIAPRSWRMSRCPPRAPPRSTRPWRAPAIADPAPTPASPPPASVAPEPSHGHTEGDGRRRRAVVAKAADPAAEPLAVIATNGALAAAANGHANGNGNGKTTNGNGGGAAPITLNLGASTKVSFQTQADAPSCMDCGSIMVRNGSCYKCLNCGSTSGCS